MGLVIELIVAVKQIDGSPEVAVSCGETTVNPLVGDIDSEVGLAKAAVRMLMAEAGEKMDEKLDDWGSAVKVIRQRAQEGNSG